MSLFTKLSTLRLSLYCSLRSNLLQHHTSCRVLSTSQHTCLRPHFLSSQPQSSHVLFSNTQSLIPNTISKFASSDRIIRKYWPKEDANTMLRYSVKPEQSINELKENGLTTRIIQEVRASDSGWIIRLANENGYLSWCRNTYLSTVLGVAIMAEATGPMMQILGYGYLSWCRNAYLSTVLGVTMMAEATGPTMQIIGYGYLSWCRNTYLTTVLGVAMMAEATGPMMQLAGEFALIMAGIILTVGSTTFMHTIFVLRTRLHMSNLGLFIHIAGAATHMLCFILIAALYIGSIDEEEVHTLMDNI